MIEFLLEFLHLNFNKLKTTFDTSLIYDVIVVVFAVFFCVSVWLCGCGASRTRFGVLLTFDVRVRRRRLISRWRSSVSRVCITRRRIRRLRRARHIVFGLYGF